ncbi:hypothetical protein [Elizabethkingia anophelis]|uniref:hypothetical protein n=1 Tax=Elizabethkingia anophelis TaxID=1117645 RepID=UPI0009949C0F|nr:hypothetical protein [Elizabethkingia anophelis]
MGQICSHFHWTFDYLLWEIDWRIVQRMLIDASNYETDDEKKKNDGITLTEQTSEDFIRSLDIYK